jgi:ParB-like chromosome segregation protein Spo0J
MNVETIQITELSADPGNVRRHSERNIAAVTASLRRFGQQIPLVVDAANVVRVGNARLEAMKRLGWTTAQIVRTSLSGADLAAYAIADNRAGDPDVGSTFDQAALADVLSALRAEDESLVADAGYTPDELAALLGEQAGPDAESPADFPAFDESIDTEHECPKCKYVWSGSSAPKGAAA